MAQILDPLPSERSGKVLCCYVNATHQIQVARITNIPNWYFERVVFPGQRLMFEAVTDALLEIHTGMMASAILSDKIPCERLVIQTLEEDKKNYNFSPPGEILKEYKKTGKAIETPVAETKVLAAVD
jgi:Domain of unknown function (DUF1830)